MLFPRLLRPLSSYWPTLHTTPVQPRIILSAMAKSFKNFEGGILSADKRGYPSVKRVYRNGRSDGNIVSPGEMAELSDSTERCRCLPEVDQWLQVVHRFCPEYH